MFKLYASYIYCLHQELWWQITLLDPSTCVEDPRTQGKSWKGYLVSVVQTWMCPSRESDSEVTEQKQMPRQEQSCFRRLQAIRWCSQLSQGRNLRSRCIEQTAREVPGSIRVSSSHLNTLHSQPRSQRPLLSELYRIISFSVFLEDPKQKYLQISAVISFNLYHSPWGVT